jgi:hypothetical protein
MSPVGVAILVAAVAAVPALARSEPAGLDERVRAALEESLAKTPRYSCTETIERQGPGDCAGCSVLDRVRLDVVVAGGMDMYALPGGQVADDAELRRYVPAGSFHAGNFSGTLKGIILDSAQRQFVRREAAAGRPLLVFSYRVPVEAGAYQLGWGRLLAPAGYKGSFRVDAKTYRLTRLDSEAFGFPMGWDLKRLTSKTVYRQVLIGGSPFSLPATSAVDARAGGLSYKIRMGFSGCRQYGAESTIRFGETPQQVAPLSQAAREFPAGIDFEAALSDSIDFYTAAAGDRVTARVTSPRMPEIPKGTLLIGRISRLVRHSSRGSVDRWVTGIRFTELEVEGRTVPLRAMVHVLQPAPVQNNLPAGEELLFGSTETRLGPVVLRCTTH